MGVRVSVSLCARACAQMCALFFYVGWHKSARFFVNRHFLFFGKEGGCNENGLETNVHPWECYALFTPPRVSWSWLRTSKTCGCESTINGIYVRASCRGQCGDLALAEVASVSSKLWQQTLKAEMQNYLTDVGSLAETHLWSTAFQNSLAEKGFGDYSLGSPGFDVSCTHFCFVTQSVSSMDPSAQVCARRILRHPWGH